MHSEAPSFVSQVKYALNIRAQDFFLAYGIGDSSRLLLSDLRACTDVAVGLIADKKELRRCEDLSKIKIYENLGDIGGIGVFDKVYCNFAQLPPRKRDALSVLNLCHKLCASGGMVLIEQIFHIDIVDAFLKRMTIQKYWYLNRSDILFKKDALKK